jgi:ATP-dependent Clp protease protease subunit
VTSRALLLTGRITRAVAVRIVARILELETQSAERDICLLVNSPGGEVKAGLAIYEAMRFTRCDIVTVCLGDAASMAAVLLSAGTIGKRVAAPGARISIHEPWDLAPPERRTHEATRALARTNALIGEILRRQTGQPADVIARDIRGGRAMSAVEARAYGLVDHVS